MTASVGSHWSGPLPCWSVFEYDPWTERKSKFKEMRWVVESPREDLNVSVLTLSYILFAYLFH